MVTKADKIFSGNQPCQLVKNYPHFPSLGSDEILMKGTETVPETSIIFSHLTQLIAQEDFIDHNASF
jgi:hypothetical protein